MQIPEQNQLVDHLFRHEAGKMVAILTKLFGFERLEIAEDLVQDTFIHAYEIWKRNGTPENPAAWLYTVAKNKSLNYIKRQKNFIKISSEITSALTTEYAAIAQIENAFQGVSDSQLQMLFAVCHPRIPEEARVALALRTLCGFSIDEIAKSFLTNKDNINKRLFRAKEKIRNEQLKLEIPEEHELQGRLDSVLQCIYLLFSEGYYSSSQETIIRKDLCLEAMRLCLLLIEFPITNQPPVNALLALMCFHTSRFESRTNDKGGILSWNEQDQSSWDEDLINKGNYFLNESARGESMSVYHLEAMIAFHHTQSDSPMKWESLLMLYDGLLLFNSNPIVRLNRAFIISKVHSAHIAIDDIMKINGLEKHYLFNALLGELYSLIDKSKSIEFWKRAHGLVVLETEKKIITDKIAKLSLSFNADSGHSLSQNRPS